MTAQQKLQIKAIQGDQIYYQEYGEFIFISDGKVGAYLSEADLKIDKNKMIKIEKHDLFDPEILKGSRVRAKRTDIARKGIRSFYIKFKTFDPKIFCFVDESYLKMFPKYGEFYIKSEKAAIYIEMFDKPYGIIMPVHVREDEE